MTTKTLDSGTQVVELTRQERINRERLARLVETCTVFVAKKRRGKTLSLVAVTSNMRDWFGMPVVVVGSRMGLTEDYGPYTYLSERDLLNELEKVTEITKASDDELGEALDVALERLGVQIYGCILVFDEAYKFFDCRTPSDKLVRIFGYLVAQMAHYHLTILLSAPYKKMLDGRVRFQIDWTGTCFYNKKTKVCIVRFTQGLNYFPVYVRGENYFHMFDSWVILGYRTKHLEISSL